MRKIRFIKYIILLLFVLTLLGTNKPSFAISYEEILQKTISSYKNLKTFSCILEVYNKAGNNEENITYEYYFQKPDKIRLEIMEGKDKGTIIVYQNGRVRYKKGRSSKLYTFIS